MTLFKKSQFIGSFLSLFLLGSTGMVTLNSCSKDKDDEPEVILPDSDKTGNENEPQIPGDENPGGDENPEQPGDENQGGQEQDPSTTIQYPEGVTEDYYMGYVAFNYELPEQYKIYTGFMVSFNKDNKVPNYVSWELLDSETVGKENRNDYDFWQDKEIEGCSSKDYQWGTYSYQRGHMCPAADNKWSAMAMKDCMSMANIGPQYPSLNENAWETLEKKTRNWAQKYGAVWVVCGPLYDEEIDTKRIGVSNVRVPSQYFKALLYNGADRQEAIAFVFANTSNPGNLYQYAMTIDELERDLKADFFSALPDDIETAVEATYDINFWQ